MDRIKASTNIVLGINQLKDGEKNMPALIQEVCSFFDAIKGDEISVTDLKFLRYISNRIGIPHYYFMLDNFQRGIMEKLDDFDLKTFATLVSESSLHTSEDIMIHRYQEQILAKFIPSTLNRYFLSASTSFGKTFMVYEIIKKMGYMNIVLIFPTIALLSENLDKLYNDPIYSWVMERYAIHTLSDVDEISQGRNLFIYTPERFLSFMDNKDKPVFDFAFVDEIYKIDNEYLDDEEIKENERDVAYRLAVFYALLDIGTDALLAGPFIEFSKRNEEKYNPSFDNFLKDYNFSLLNYNEYEIVNKSITDIKSARRYDIDGISFNFDSLGKTDRFKIITNVVTDNGGNLIVYCSTRSQTETYARYLVEDKANRPIDFTAFSTFINHLETVFTNSGNWIVTKALKKGVGIHHGLVPKYIQKEIIRLFNGGYLKVLLSTTTITEGVNTSAKNILVLSDKKGEKLLKRFDAQNIAGRAGRFLHHYKGQVIVLKNDFIKIKDGDKDYIRHKNYDLNSRKDEIDLFYTDNQYLRREDQERKLLIDARQQELHIPNEVINSYKVVSPKDKINIYEHLCNLSSTEINLIEVLIRNYHIRNNITYDGFEIIIRVVLPIVKNENLRWLMTNRKEGKNNVILTDLVYGYLKYGFKGSVNYYSKSKGIDEAVRQSSQFIYNTLKYQVVKYWGAFNLMYKFHKSQRVQKAFDEVVGIDAFLLKLEYNSSTREGRLASDYGVPQKVVEYYDAGGKLDALRIQRAFDDFEKSEYEKVKKVIGN